MADARADVTGAAPGGLEGVSSHTCRARAGNTCRNELAGTVAALTRPCGWLTDTGLMVPARSPGKAAVGPMPETRPCRVLPRHREDPAKRFCRARLPELSRAARPPPRACPHLAARPRGTGRARAFGHGPGQYLSPYGYRTADRRSRVNVLARMSGAPWIIVCNWIGLSAAVIAGER